MAKHTPLISQFLEKISRSVLEENYQGIIRKYVAKRHGVYALYHGDQLYYVGLASNLRIRLRHHLRDRHGQSWDRFSVYLTIDDSHIKELESLVVRIASPEENKQEGKFARAENLQNQLVRDIRRWHQDIIDRVVKPTPTSSQNPTGRISVLSKYIKNIPTPMKLRAKFKNKSITARVAKDGTIRFARKTYSSPSLAAAAACNRQSCNGWTFWKYERAPGDWVFIDQLRNLSKPRRKPSVKPTPTSSKNRTGRIPVLSKYIKSIPAPRNLNAKFKNKSITAKVAKDGTINFAGKTYTSPSEAAAVACKRQSCNGWTFWKYERAPGDWVFIDQLRK